MIPNHHQQTMVKTDGVLWGKTSASFSTTPTTLRHHLCQPTIAVLVARDACTFLVDLLTNRESKTSGALHVMKKRMPSPTTQLLPTPLPPMTNLPLHQTID